MLASRQKAKGRLGRSLTAIRRASQCKVWLGAQGHSSLDFKLSSTSPGRTFFKLLLKVIADLLQLLPVNRKLLLEFLEFHPKFCR